MSNNSFTISFSGFVISSYNIFSSSPSKLFNNSVINACLFLKYIFVSFFSWYVLAISFMVSDTIFSWSIVSLLCSNPLLLYSGNILSVLTSSSIFMPAHFGIASNPSDAINASFITTKSFAVPFVAYNNIPFPIRNPAITPIFPNLFSNPATIPESAYIATTIGSFWAIIPNVTPIVTPAVAPTKTPFFHPKISTINMLKIFLIDNPNIEKSPSAEKAMETNKLAPITSSIENASFSIISCITINEFTNIL